MFASPPGCYLHHQASFITDFFVHDFPNLKPGADFTFFGFPDINPQYSGAQVVAAQGGAGAGRGADCAGAAGCWVGGGAAGDCRAGASSGW